MQNINCTLLKLFNTIIQVIYFVTKYWVFLFNHVTQTFTPSFKFTIFALHLLMTGIKTGIDRYLTPLHIADQCTCHGFWSRTQAIVLHRYFFLNYKLQALDNLDSHLLSSRNNNNNR